MLFHWAIEVQFELATVTHFFFRSSRVGIFDRFRLLCAICQHPRARARFDRRLHWIAILYVEGKWKISCDSLFFFTMFLCFPHIRAKLPQKKAKLMKLIISLSIFDEHTVTMCMDACLNSHPTQWLSRKLKNIYKMCVSIGLRKAFECLIIIEIMWSYLIGRLRLALNLAISCGRDFQGLTSTTGKKEREREVWK